MNRYRLVHVTEFTYDGPVSESYNQVWLRPRQDERQSCLSFRLSTEPHSRASSYIDGMGNWVHRFNIITEHRRLRVEAESVVLVQDTAPMPLSTPLLEALSALAGELDEITPVADAQSMQAAIPRSTLTVVRGAGHLSNLEQPVSFNKALADFLLARL